jgi:hypothetical protein
VRWWQKLLSPSSKEKCKAPRYSSLLASVWTSLAILQIEGSHLSPCAAEHKNIAFVLNFKIRCQVDALEYPMILSTLSNYILSFAAKITNEEVLVEIYQGSMSTVELPGTGCYAGAPFCHLTAGNREAPNRYW